MRPPQALTKKKGGYSRASRCVPIWKSRFASPPSGTSQLRTSWYLCADGASVREALSYLGRSDFKSGLACPNHTANLSEIVLGCIEANCLQVNTIFILKHVVNSEFKVKHIKTCNSSFFFRARAFERKSQKDQDCSARIVNNRKRDLWQFMLKI